MTGSSAGCQWVKHTSFKDYQSAARLAPDNMSGHVHVFDAREGGIFRISLKYQVQAHSLSGKTSEDTDTFRGDCRIDPLRRIVEVLCSSRRSRDLQLR